MVQNYCGAIKSSRGGQARGTVQMAVPWYCPATGLRIWWYTVTYEAPGVSICTKCGTHWVTFRVNCDGYGHRCKLEKFNVQIETWVQHLRQPPCTKPCIALSRGYPPPRISDSDQYRSAQLFRDRSRMGRVCPGVASSTAGQDLEHRHHSQKQSANFGDFQSKLVRLLPFCTPQEYSFRVFR
eukprot:3768808-Rhodomonas_salina.1